MTAFTIESRLFCVAVVLAALSGIVSSIARWAFNGKEIVAVMAISIIALLAVASVVHDKKWLIALAAATILLVVAHFYPGVLPL